MLRNETTCDLCPLYVRTTGFAHLISYSRTARSSYPDKNVLPRTKKAFAGADAIKERTGYSEYISNNYMLCDADKISSLYVSY